MGSHTREVMIPSVGVDIVSVDRIQRLISRHPAALKRLFTEEEIRQSGHSKQTWPRLASRFAAKEAVVKACGGLRGGRYVDIEIRRQPGQAPQVVVYGALGRWITEHHLKIRISVSHEDHYAMAYVALYSETEEQEST